MNDDIILFVKTLGYPSSIINNHNQNQISQLLSDFSNDIIKLDDVSDILKSMNKRQKILENHKQFCNIWKATDGRFKTKLPTENGKKLVAKQDLTNLENYIVDYYLQSEKKSAEPTLESIYDEWMEYKLLESTKANCSKIQWVWKKYYENSSIVTIPLSKLNTGTIKKWLLEQIQNNQLSDRKFKELKSIINMMFDYATSFDLIQVNLARQVRGFSKNLFTIPATKSLSEIIYSSETKKDLIADALNQFKKTKNIAYLAVCINFSLGLRVGELVAVRESCFLNDNLIRISQEEVKKYYRDASGQIHREGYEIVNHTKTLQGVRELVVTEQTRKWFDMVREYNIQNGLKDEDFLFLDKKGNRIHDHAINNVIRRLNGVRNEKDAFVITDRPSGNHSIRKTCISELHESKLFSDDTIKTFAGHKDISTTQKCYIFETQNITAYADNFQKVFDN